jgi:hypothetical protein
MKVRIKLKESVVSKLKSLEARDQAERNEYLKNYLEPFGYEKGVAKWIKDKNRDPNDVFNDAKHYPEIKKLVGELMKNDKPLKEDVLNVANVLVIHMDKDRKFQHEFLDFLSKHHYVIGYHVRKMEHKSTEHKTVANQIKNRRIKNVTVVKFSKSCL